MDSTLHNIMNGLIVARVHAERLADSQPQDAVELNRFIEGLDRLKQDLVDKMKNRMRQ